VKPVMYLVANKGLNMSRGKLGAQCGHGAVRAYRRSNDRIAPSHRELLDEWWETGETKIVLEARDTEHLLLVERFVKERGIDTVLVIDEGRTEIAPHSPTVLGSVVVDKDDPNVQHAFGDLRTYREDKPKLPDPTKRKRLGRWLDYLPES
jgi:peptidyl-tRNA hydrolase